MVNAVTMGVNFRQCNSTDPGHLHEQVHGGCQLLPLRHVASCQVACS